MNLVKLLEGNTTTELPPNLVVLQTGDSNKNPLFLIHPGGRHIYFYQDLVHHLDNEQPVYGIQAQGTYGNSKPLTKVEEMAAKYIKVIQTVQPKGPYFLGGACFGGVVALEMAQLFILLEQKVDFLAVIDAPIPDKVPQKMKLSYYFGQINAAIKMLPDWNITRISNMLKLNYFNYQAFLNYKPKNYSGKIVFFSAEERDIKNTKILEQAWISLTTGKIDIYKVPGNHITMNLKPNVKILSEQLTTYIEKAYI